MKRAIAWLFTAFWILCIGCSKERNDECGPSSARPVDSALVAFLSRTRAAHHLADQAEQRGALGQAVDSLQAVVRGPLPSPEQLAPETREVLADTLGRIAHLQSKRGAFDEADRALEQGLAHAPHDSYFEGYLFEVRGLNEEARAAALQSKGDQAGALAAKQRAISALERSMRIQAAVIEQAHKAAAEPRSKSAP